jgi:hypothetical protein
MPVAAPVGGIHREVRLLIIGLVLGCFSLLVTGSFRDWVDSSLHAIIPVGSRSIGKGKWLVFYNFCYFMFILAILVCLSVSIVA